MAVTRPVADGPVPIPARWALVGAAGLVAASAATGLYLTRHGVRLHIGSTYPIAGRYRLHLTGWLLPALALGVPGLWSAPKLARTLRWPALLVAAGAAAAAWAVALALVGGGPAAVAAPLTRDSEYLAEVPGIDAMGVDAFLHGFDGRILGSGGTPGWITHVAGHPPLATLAFVLLHRLGLSGAGWAAALCIAGGAVAVPAVLDTVRRAGAPDLARYAAPYVALAPAALWVASSADALFAGVAAAGIWAVAAAARWRVLALIGGVLLGAALFLSYGLVLLAPLAVAAALAAHRSIRAAGLSLALAAAGVAGVVGCFAAAGFRWWDGLALAGQRVRLGEGWIDRPAAYFAVANLAAFAVALGPAVVAALPLGAARREKWLVVPGAALLAVLAAVASQLSLGEVERIYLPFAVWLLPLAALLPARPGYRGWFGAHLGWALLLAATTTLAW